jgi:hypothetical protein
MSDAFAEAETFVPPSFFRSKYPDVPPENDNTLYTLLPADTCRISENGT